MYIWRPTPIQTQIRFIHASPICLWPSWLPLKQTKTGRCYSRSSTMPMARDHGWWSYRSMCCGDLCFHQSQFSWLSAAELIIALGSLSSSVHYSKYFIFFTSVIFVVTFSLRQGSCGVQWINTMKLHHYYTNVSCKQIISRAAKFNVI